MCTASTVDGIALSELSEKDFQPVSCLLSRSFGGKPEWYTAYFKYWWKHNPAWNETIPRGWVAKSDNGDAVAFTSNIPFEYRINGASALRCATGSTAVDARWRGQGLSKRVASRFLQQPNPALLVGTGSTEVAYRMWLSLGMKPLQRSWPSSSYCILGSVTGYAQTKLNNKVPALAFRITGAVETAIYGTLIAGPRRARQTSKRSIALTPATMRICLHAGLPPLPYIRYVMQKFLIGYIFIPTFEMRAPSMWQNPAAGF